MSRDRTDALARGFEDAPAAVVVLDSGYRVVAANAEARLLYGGGEGGLVGRPFPELVRVGGREEGCLEALGAAAAAGRLRTEVEQLGASGRRAWVDWSVWPVRDGGGGEVLLSFALDLTARREQERALRQSEELYRSLVRTSPDAIVLTDLEGRILAASEAAARQQGVESSDELVASARNAFDLVAPEDRARAAENMRRALEDGVVHQLHYRVVREDGSSFPAELSAAPFRDEAGRPIGFIGIVRDVSERERAERERATIEAVLRQQQRLESIGTLASGVAHEVNNPVNVVMNYAQLIIDRSEPSSEAAAYALEIVRESHRIAGTVRSLLAFSRQGFNETVTAPLGEVVESTLHLVGQLLQRDQIQLAVELAPETPPVRCRRQQVQQVVMNLVMNARDALADRFGERGSGKVLRVSTSRLEEAGRTLCRLTVEDNGPGIPPEFLGRVFDPFFTTKPRDKGTGLGLWVSAGIVREHEGRILVDSAPGRPTRIHVDLPAAS